MYKFNDKFYTDVRIEDRYSSEIRLKNGQLEECKEQSVKKAFIRVFDGNMWYYSSTCDTEGLQKEIDALYLYATPNDNIDEHPVVKKFQVNKDTVMRFAKDKVSDIPLEKKVAYISSAAEKLKSPHLNLGMGLYLDRYSVFNFYSSKGADITYDFQTAGAALSVALSSGNDQFENRSSKAGAYFKDAEITDAEIKELLDESENFLMNAVPLDKAGSYPVVLAPEVTGVFAHESFGHKSEADFMLGDETMAKEWSIGKKVASDVLTIKETGTIEGSGYVPYDDEGTKAGVTYLIDKGVLSGRLHSATTAAYLGEELTGNARAMNCDFEPIVRMTNTYIEGGDSTFEELVSGIKDGFYVKSCKHGSGMSTFTIAPNVCYRIRDGKLAEPVKIAVLTGNVFETLGLIDGVADDRKILSFVGGGCGKMEQFPLPVGLGGPHIRVSEINVQ